jgi:hypothetical protein
MTTLQEEEEEKKEKVSNSEIFLYLSHCLV